MGDDYGFGTVNCAVLRDGMWSPFREIGSSELVLDGESVPVDVSGCYHESSDSIEMPITVCGSVKDMFAMPTDVRGEHSMAYEETMTVTNYRHRYVWQYKLERKGCRKRRTLPKTTTLSFRTVLHEVSFTEGPDGTIAFMGRGVA